MEKQITTKEIFNGKVLKIRLDEVELDDGRKGEREVVHHPGGAAILVVKDGKVLLERQYRYAVGKEVIEIPAGKRDKGEDFLQTATEEECVAALKNQFPGIEDESIVASIKRYVEIDAWVNHLTMKKSALDNLCKIMQNAGELTKTVDYDKLVRTDISNMICGKIDD